MDNLRELFYIMTRGFGFLDKQCCISSFDCCQDVEISPIQSHILYEINRQHQPSIQKIAETLGTDITTFSRQIQTLVKMDLVKKTPHPEDRRISLLSLTEKGKSLSIRIDQEMKAYLNEVFSHMNDFEKETVIRSIKLLNEAMANSKRCCSP